MPVYYDKSKKRWRFSFNRIIATKRTRATKLLPAAWSRTQAEKYDREETARLYAIATGVHRPEPTIGAAVAIYIDHRVPRLRNGKKVVQDLAKLAGYIDGRPISELADAAREYVKDHPGLADGTIHNRLAYLRAACRYAWKKHRLTQHNPTEHMEVPVPANERLVNLPVARLEQQLRRIEDLEARALFTLAFFTGSRWISEIHPRVPSDVHRRGREVELQIGLTKNGEPRLVPVHPKARWALRHLPFKYGARWYYERFVKARLASGLQGLRPHDMRHVLGAAVIARTGNQRDVMEALHHQSIQSSMRYSKFNTKRLRRVLYGVGQSIKMHTTRATRSRRKAA